MTRMLYEDSATCIGCGCTDERACRGGCSWLRVDYSVGKGVCSRCPRKTNDWDRERARPKPMQAKRLNGHRL